MPEPIHILSAGAVQPGLIKVIEAFSRESGDDVAVSFATAPAIAKRIAAGEMIDVVIAPHGVIDEFVGAGKVASSNRATLGRIGVGVMIRIGAPLPNVVTVEALKTALINAEAIVFNQASTGVYVESLFDQLGIGAQIKNKITRYPDFAAVLEHVGKGHGNEIAFGATTVIIENASKGVRFVGPLPAEIQNYTVYTAALSANASDAARALLRYFATPAAKAIFTAAGIEQADTV
jgi:molybdate transport system substrate-binding protein